MSPHRSLGALLLVALAAAGCGAGRHTETDKERATPYLAQASAGPIAVRAVRVVLADSAATTTTTTSTPSPSAGAAPQAYLIASLVNQGSQSDSLTGATVSGGSVQPIGFTSDTVALPPQQVVLLGSPDLGSSGEMLGVGALSTSLVAGTTTRVTFTFQSAGTVSLQVPVLTSSDVGTTASAAPVTAAG